MSLRVVTVRRSRMALSCDWPGCDVKMCFPEREGDIDRDLTELAAAFALARHLGWEITDDMDGEAVCPNHPREEP